MQYKPQKITRDLIERAAKAEPPASPREIRDRSRGLILRHQPSGYLSIYVQLDRGKRERICNARDILDNYNPVTITEVFERAKVLRGEAATGRDFAGERKASRAVPTLNDYIRDTYEPWALANRRSGAAMVARLRSCFGSTFGRKKLTSITIASVETWAAKRIQGGIAAETANRDVGGLRAALSRAVRFKVIDANPIAGIELAQVDTSKQSVIALTASQKADLLNALDIRDATKRQKRSSHNEWRKKRGREPLPAIGQYADPLTPAVIVSLETGVRRSELFALEWPSVDLAAKLLRVKGTTTKSYLTREIPLNKAAVDALRNWWMQEGQPKVGYVFTIEGEQVKNLKHSYHAVLADAGIPRVNDRDERINWHSLRHTFGTLLGATNIDAPTLKKLMGHANLETTQRYLHSDAERMREAVERLHG